MVFPLTIGKPLNMRTGRISKKCGKITEKSRENQIFVSAMSEIPPNKLFQPWNINIVDTSLQYARYIATRKVALTISLAYSTIKEWYYLVREQEKFQAAGQNANFSFQEGELFNPHIYNLLNFVVSFLNLLWWFLDKKVGVVESETGRNIIRWKIQRTIIDFFPDFLFLHYFKRLQQSNYIDYKIKKKKKHGNKKLHK